MLQVSEKIICFTPVVAEINQMSEGLQFIAEEFGPVKNNVAWSPDTFGHVSVCLIVHTQTHTRNTRRAQRPPCCSRICVSTRSLL